MENATAVAIVAFATMGIGLFAWAFGLSQASVQVSVASEQTGAAVLQERSNFVIEDVVFSGGRIHLRLYNIGSVRLQIISITVSKANEGQGYDFKDWGTLDVQESKVFVVYAKKEDGLRISVFGLASLLFDENDASLNVQWGVSRVWKQ